MNGNKNKRKREKKEYQTERKIRQLCSIENDVAEKTINKNKGVFLLDLLSLSTQHYLKRNNKLLRWKENLTYSFICTCHHHYHATIYEYI